jgi:methanogenic corrinoid protein MtbC1/uroporphyrinogen-III decarboxylase
LFLFLIQKNTPPFSLKEGSLMAERDHIPLGVGFYPDWFWRHYGISFDRKYYFDPEARIEARMEIDKRLAERFGDVGLGNPNPKPKPLITFGMVMLPAIFGCEIVFKDDALPWAMPLNLSEDEVMKLGAPDILDSWPMTEVLRQIEYLKERYGRVVGDINTTGVQNLALKLRGEQLYIDYFENPKLCHHLLKFCTDCIIRLFRTVYEITGTGAIDVTPMCDPRLFVLPNCTVEQISRETYETFVLPYDNQVADACHPVGIHHCGSVNQVLEAYAKVRHLDFVEVGFGSDVKRTRQVFGPTVAVNARINPVLMKNATPRDVEDEVKRIIDQGAPLRNFSIDTVGLTHGTPDENVKVALRTAADYGRIPDDTPGKVFYSIPQTKAPLETLVSGGAKSVLIGPRRPLVLIGERINPTGRKDLAQAIEKGDLRVLQDEALKQVREGAHILDVNVGVSGIDEPKVLQAAIQAIQEITDVPLCIDSASPKAIEAGLKVYKGKALVNSVNGEKQKLAQVLPLAKEHGAAVIGLTMDDRGIPKDAVARLEIARLIVGEAEALGIPREDVIIDPLAMALSADHEAGYETIRALRLIRDELGVNQTLGLSNVSFGLPERSTINAMFLAMAALSGLTCPILDPTVWEMRKALLISDMILGRDEYCMGYLSVAGRKEGAPEKRQAPPLGLEALQEAVILGRRREAAEHARQALEQGTDAQDLINLWLIPALDEVGKRFEKREIFVPEMMMAAKSMQACVDIAKPRMKGGGAPLATVVLGTVFGDLHDIGKNLVKLLLESSGFRVVDLGENVPARTFVEAARQNAARIVGISSLLTTGDLYVAETIRAVRDSDVGGKVRIVCGGAALTQRFVEQVCGADAYAGDAAEGVRKIKELLRISDQ